ncbi:MAG: DUF1707 SHOCT-like domain-containing protein [Motilibacteraceae bacterium]
MGDEAGGRNLRCGHEDRDAVAERLRVAAGDGRIDLDELDNRLAQAYAARSYADLDRLVTDLPGAGLVRPAASDVAAPGAPSPSPARVRAVFTTRVHRGAWVVPERLEARVRGGKIVLDLVDAVVPHRTVTVDVRAFAGTVVVVVPEGWSVSTEGASVLLGSLKVRTRPAATGAPDRLVLTGRVLLGDLVVRHRYQLPWGSR